MKRFKAETERGSKREVNEILRWKNQNQSKAEKRAGRDETQTE